MSEQCHHNRDREGCRMCLRAARGATATAPARAAVALLPCIHMGDPLGPRELEAAGLARGLKVWRECEHPEQPLGPRVCTCNGCGPNCRGYSAEAEGGRAIILTGGIGDAFALESMLRPEERERLDGIYYACPAALEVSQLWKALPNYPRLRSHIILPTGTKAYYTKADVEADLGALLDVEDYSIGKLFAEHRPYVGSSFLTYPLAKVRLPAEPYVIVCPSSSWGKWPGRSFDAADWAVCLEFLEGRNLHGLVLGKIRNWAIPSHPRLIDRRDKTTILEAVELVKAARGYLGIDTCWSVLAVKQHTCLAVKSVSGFTGRWKTTYFAPRQEFGFMQRALTAPRAL